MTIENIKAFNTKLGSVCKRAKNLRSDVQQLVVFAVAQVEEHGNLTPLSHLLLQTKPLRTIRTSTLEAYIMHHVSNIHWTGKGKDKTLAKIKGQTIAVSELEGNWYEFDNDGVEAKTLDVKARIQSLLKAIEKADKGEGVVYVTGQETLAHQLQAVLTPFANGEEVDVTVDDQPAGIHTDETGNTTAVAA